MTPRGNEIEEKEVEILSVWSETDDVDELGGNHLLKALQEYKQLIRKETIDECRRFIYDNPHWNISANTGAIWCADKLLALKDKE